MEGAVAASVKLAVPVGAPELIAADRFTVHVTRAEVTPRLLHVTLPTPVPAVATVAVTPAMAADNYPSKPARLILPFGAGASTDIIGRIFAQRFSEAWGQTLVVDNRAGAGGIVSADLLIKSAPDGYTLGSIFTSFTTNVALRKVAPYDPVPPYEPVRPYESVEP